MSDFEGEPQPYIPAVPLQAYLAEAITYDDLRLDLAIAQLHAIAQVYRAHSWSVTALFCDDYWQGLAEIRRTRGHLAETVDDAMYPSRPLTAGELAEDTDEGDA